ncbi:MAG TPA: hypothetical protein VNT01_02135 [Symbiobacteriaceae bacterium]|nr:hypothetical protein [Symbiobacteriaceae bacterium]
MKPVLAALMLMIIVTGCAAQPALVEEGARSIGQCAPPPSSPWFSAAPDNWHNTVTSDVAQGEELLPLGPEVAVTADQVRVTYRFFLPPDANDLSPAVMVTGAARVTCRWLSHLDLAVDLAGLRVGSPVVVEGPAGPVTVVRQNAPRVTVTAPDGRKLVPGGERRPEIVTGVSPLELMLSFDRPMDRAGVERKLAPFPVVWMSDRQAVLPVDALQAVIPTGGLPARDGTESVGGDLHLYRNESAHVPVGFEGGMQSPDGKVLLFHQRLGGGKVYGVRPWLQSRADLRMIPLPDSFTAGPGYTYIALPLRDEKGAVVMDHMTVWHYDLKGNHRMILFDDGLIRGAAVNPRTGLMALLLQRPGEEIRLKVLDPAAPEPFLYAKEYSTGGLKDAGQLRLEWNSDQEIPRLTNG